jgi:hypothetical protein
MEVIMTKTKKASGRRTPAEIEPRPSEEEEREESAEKVTSTPVATSKYAGLIPGAIVLGLIALAIVFSILTD